MRQSDTRACTRRSMPTPDVTRPTRRLRLPHPPPLLPPSSQPRAQCGKQPNISRYLSCFEIYVAEYRNVGFGIDRSSWHSTSCHLLSSRTCSTESHRRSNGLSRYVSTRLCLVTSCRLPQETCRKWIGSGPSCLLYTPPTSRCYRFGPIRPLCLYSHTPPKRFCKMSLQITIPGRC